MSTYTASASAISTTAAQGNQIIIPTLAATGTFMLLQYTGSQTQPDSNPQRPDGTLAGWVRLGQDQGGTCYATWWWRTATSGDAGSTIVVPASLNAKTALTLTVFSATATVSPVAAWAIRPETASSATHADPATLALPSGWNGKIIRCLALKDTTTGVSGVWNPATGAATPPPVRVSADTGGISAVIGVQASGTSDTSTYTSRSWSVFAANGTTAVASQHAVTLVLALTDATVTPPPSDSGVRGVMTGGNSGATATATSAVLTLPGAAAAGDTAAIIATSNLGTGVANPPVGWHTEASGVVSTNHKTYIFSKNLTAADITAGTVTITWNSGGRNLASGIVMYGLDASAPFGQVAQNSAVTATQAAPTVTTTLDNSQVLTMTSSRTNDGAASVPTYPSGWTRKTNVATAFATTSPNMSCSIATLNTPGLAGTYGGETVSFSGPGTTSDSSEQIYTLACQTTQTMQAPVGLVYQRSGSTLRPVTMARREGSTIVLL